jgi:arabinoxylan arabinofuranohydrolase
MSKLKRMTKSFTCSLIIYFIIGLSSISAQDLNKYPIKSIKNPLIDEPGMSDPHMLVVNDTCYVFTGHDVGFGISDWVMPDWRIFMSTDLQNWIHVGTISPKDNIMGEGNTNCWAGDIATRNGKYYWYYSNRKEGTGVMVADRPEGPYKDALGDYLVDSFDPSIFVDDDYTPYIIYGEGTYKIARLKESMIELDEEPKEISINRTTYFPETDKNSLHKHNGIYYLSCSGYYATSDNIYGPYDTQGVVGKGFGLDTGYGHGDFFIWKGDWYHTWCRYINRSKDRIRDSFIAPIYYKENGIMYNDTRHINEKYKSSGIN